MRAILKDDDVIIIGNNVPILLNAGDPEISAAFQVPSGYNAGKATGRFPKVGGLTYVEASQVYPGLVPDELGGGTNRTVLVYVASAFVLGDVPGATPTPAPAGSTPAPGSQPTSTPANTPGSTPAAGPTGPTQSPLDAADAPSPATATNKWLVWGLATVLGLAIVGLILVMVRPGKGRAANS